MRRDLNDAGEAGLLDLMLSTGRFDAGCPALVSYCGTDLLCVLLRKLCFLLPAASFTLGVLGFLPILWLN